MQTRLFLAAPALFALAGASFAQTADQRIIDLEAKVDALFAELDAASSPATSAADNFSFGGYGEYHFNLGQGAAKYADPHRFVFYMGYDFGSGIQLHSETEIEHGFVKDGNGEVSIEQLYVDIDVFDESVLTIGRMLNPLGRINLHHEPTVFNGVERPNVEKYIIPSTWSQDGLGFRTSFTDHTSHQFQLTNGLDGSKFTADDGIRGGRVKERPGLESLALSYRFDNYYEDIENLHSSFGFYAGRSDDANKGGFVASHSYVNILTWSLDYSVSDFDFIALYATSGISNTGSLNTAFNNDVADHQGGHYIEAAWHALGRDDIDTDARFPESDLILFARYEGYDTQDGTLNGGAVDSLTSSRKETTLGIGWWLTPKFVLKADYQILEFDDSGAPGRPNQLNFGIGWTL